MLKSVLENNTHILKKVNGEKNLVLEGMEKAYIQCGAGKIVLFQYFFFSFLVCEIYTVMLVLMCIC